MLGRMNAEGVECVARAMRCVARPVLALRGVCRPKACGALLGQYMPRTGKEAPKALVALLGEYRPKAGDASLGV